MGRMVKTGGEKMGATLVDRLHGRPTSSDRAASPWPLGSSARTASIDNTDAPAGGARWGCAVGDGGAVQGLSGRRRGRHELGCRIGAEEGSAPVRRTNQSGGGDDADASGGWIRISWIMKAEEVVKR